MIRTILVLEGGLVRGALAYVLSAQHDIEVIGEMNRVGDVEATIDDERPDMMVVDLDLFDVGDLPRARASYERIGQGHVLALMEPRRAGPLSTVITQHCQDVGFVDKNAPPHRVIDAIRRLDRGEMVIDGNLVAAALDAASPLTTREREVLDMAAAGSPVHEIAVRLGLAQGTVRNHLSRVMAKTGARTRIQAVRMALDSGWI